MPIRASPPVRMTRSLYTSSQPRSAPSVIALQADVGDKAGCYALAEAIKSAGEKSLDILINNSGITWGGVLDDFPEEKGWDKVFHLNVKSQFYLTVA